VVEDNDLNRQIAEELLTGEGAVVELAEGGLEGVDKVLEGAAPYDLVIMDMQMPDIDGLEATRRIRADGRFDELPILAMTANASASDREACLAAGMDEHVGKPIDMEQVVPLVLALTGGMNEELSLAAKASEQTVAEPVQKSKTIALPKVVLGDDVLARFRGRVELLKRVQKQFGPEITRWIELLEQALVQDDRTGGQQALHSIKGTAGTMGAKAMADFAALLEARLKTEQNNPLQQIVDAPQMDHLKALLTVSDEALASLVTTLSNNSPAPATKPPGLDNEHRNG